MNRFISRHSVAFSINLREKNSAKNFIMREEKSA